MVRVCQQCGDKGFSNAFIHCVKCLNYVVHRYCLDELPKTFDESVYWVCDNCGVDMSKELTSLKSTSNQFEGRDHMGSNDVDGQLTVVGGRSPRLKWMRKSVSLLGQEAGRRLETSPYSEPEDAELAISSSLSTGFKKKDASCLSTKVKDQLLVIEASTELKITERSNSARSSAKDVEGQQIVVACKGQKRSVLQHRVSPSKQAQDAELAINSPLSTELKKKSNCYLYKPGDANTKLVEKSNGEQELSSLENFKKKRMEVKSSSTNLSEHCSKEFSEASQLALDHLENNSTVDNREQAEPFIEPIWRGDFIIQSKDYEGFDDGLVAHLSSKACRKVYEEAMLLPSSLDLEMLAKLDCWPKSFQKSRPSDDDIALYFFPLNKRSEGLFDHLVEEMIDQGLALKAIVKNAELLIFASNELPLNLWRFKGKYYLWGVFRGKRASSFQAEGLRDSIKEDT
ncbi:hypothetical protein ACH5RR_026546 [Cinchona calisaya]|uniref:AIPP2-like SPOC-like domain-containing protein n=1 Tax=Cinchona calisaya TaxID=153742 RepID=A0ABD2Z403_9GENT